MIRLCPTCQGKTIILCPHFRDRRCRAMVADACPHGDHLLPCPVCGKQGFVRRAA